MRSLTLAILTLLLVCPRGAAAAGYERPPQAVLDVLNARPTPLVSFSPDRERMILIDWVRYPPIADLARPMLRLAGLRIDPNTNGPHEPRRNVGFRLRALEGGSETVVKVPPGAWLSAPIWAPDSKRFAFTHTGPAGIELWVGDAGTGAVRSIPNLRLNAVYGTEVRWLSGSRTLLCQQVDPSRLKSPPAAAAPAPTVQESTGEKAPVRTFQDLLETPRDEALFDHYARSQLVTVDVETGKIAPVGKPALFGGAEASPDGNHLLVTRIVRPYSYLVGVWAFPRVIEVWDRSGRVVKEIARLPLAEKVPIGGVLTGPRGVEWLPTEPATLQWTEALDGGDPNRKASHRDRLLLSPAPFAAPREWLKTEHRCTGTLWLETGASALVTEFDRDRRWTRTFLAAREGGAPRLLWDRSVNDRYGNPGSPLGRVLPNGHGALIVRNGRLFLEGVGASPEGDRPFLDRLDVDTLKAERLFRCDPGAYETVVALRDGERGQFITRRETEREPPNYLLRSPAGPARTLTSFRDPTPQIRGIKKHLVTYRRADGVPLSFTLYLPAGYREGDRLPTLVWAYPREFGDAGTAGQVSGSPHRFTTLAGISHLFLVLQGYAVLDAATMPVVGAPETANDTFIEQIVASARAAIDKGVEMGVVDRDRVIVGGHSYGAFMTANLLAHSDLFRAGIARSGAYNRTLTPFGFQSERRTLWEAPEIYSRLSPFNHAHRINEPLLLIHGEADDNPGTFPVQTERLFHAIKGNGGVARYVTLPYEAHGYIARESVEHTLYEMIAWANRHTGAARGTGSPASPPAPR